jgi:hypothetical protein
MSAATHTPGPWSLDGHNVLHPDGERCIAEVHAVDGVMQPNARLIAASPEMWAVLDELEGAFDKEIYPEQCKEDFDAPDDREYTVTITAKQWRALGRALSKAGAK